MMKQHLDLLANWFVRQSNQPTRAMVLGAAGGISLIGLAGLGGGPAWAQTEALANPIDLAQVYEVAPPPPAGAIPVPSDGAMPPSAAGDSQNITGQQYVVFVNGNSDMLLDQVRLVEPTAFRTNHQGRTVIQAGRFNSPQNAQQRLSDLSTQGVSARVTEVAAAMPYYAQPAAQPSNVYAVNGELPPIPTGNMAQGTPALPEVQPVPELPAVPATPAAPQEPGTGNLSVPAAAGQGSVEFGQELAYSAPPNPNAYPVNTTPPGTAAAAVPATSARISAPYYVVIPTAEGNLPELSTQIIQLGTPADRVQQRLTPRGPHVAIGPFEDRGLASQWNQFYREAGIANSRVHYDP